MALELTGMKCCGIRELSGLSHQDNPQKSMYQFARLTYLREIEDSTKKGSFLKRPDPGFRYILFSQARRDNKYGVEFGAYIESNGLGKVAETPFNVNPNSSNPLKIFIWTVDHDALKAWVKKNEADILTTTPRPTPPPQPIYAQVGQAGQAPAPVQPGVR